MNFTTITQWIETHFNKRTLLIGVGVIIAFLFLQRLACPPKPVVVSTHTQDSSSVYRKQVDSLVREIRQINISKALIIPNSDSSTAAGQRIDTVYQPYYVYIHDKKEVKIPIKDLQSDSCPAVLLHQFIPMQANAGYYELNGLVSCKTGIAYNIQIIAHGVLRFDTIITDTTTIRFLRDSVFRLQNRLEQKTLQQPAARFELYGYGQYDPFFTKRLEFGAGGDINFEMISLYGNVGLGTGGVSSTIGLNYFFFRK